MLNKILIRTSDRKTLHKDRRTLGMNGENLQEVLLFCLDEKIEGTGIVEVELPNGEKGMIQVECTEEGYELPVKSSLLSQTGFVKFQLRILHDNEEIFKSEIIPLEVKDSINATATIPEEYPSWVDTLTNLKKDLEKAESERVSNENERISAEKTRQENFTKMQKTVSSAVSNIKELTEEYNSNAEQKTNAFNSNAETKTNNFNQNHTEKTTDFDTDVATKTNEFDTNAANKTTEFNNNAKSKTDTFNSNAETKTNEYNSNAQNKINEYDEHAVEFITRLENVETKNTEQDTNIQKNTKDIEEINKKDKSQDDLIDTIENALPLAQNVLQDNTIIINDASNHPLQKLEIRNTNILSQNGTANFSNPIDIDNVISGEIEIKINDQTNIVDLGTNEIVKLKNDDGYDDYLSYDSKTKTLYLNKNIRKLVLDGTKGSWSKRNSASMFELDLNYSSDIPYKGNSERYETGNSSNLICNYLPKFSNNWSTDYVLLVYTGQIWFRFLFDDELTADNTAEENFEIVKRKWAEKPLEIYYRKKETEKISLGTYDLDLLDGENTITITTNNSSTTKIEYVTKIRTYKAGSNINIDENTINLALEDNSIYTNKLESAKLNLNGNLIEKHKIMYLGYIYLSDGTKHIGNHGMYKFTKEFLDLDNYSYMFDQDSYVTFWDENNNFISGTLRSSLIGVNWAKLGGGDITPPNNWSYVLLGCFEKVLENMTFARRENAVHNLKTTYYVDDLAISNEKTLKTMLSNLNNKTGIFFGDSWCAGNQTYLGSWCKYIQEHVNTFKATNCGRHGADWWQAYNYWFDGTHSDIIDKDYDYVIIEAYTNGLYGDVSDLSKELGAIDEFTYYSSLEEMSTALGNTYAYDLEKFIYTVVNKWEGKKIGLMFPYKSVAMMSETNAFRVFREQVIRCANKYNIPVLDNFNSCNIPARTTEQINTYFFNGDGVHLNANGNLIIGNTILSWLEKI